MTPRGSPEDRLAGHGGYSETFRPIGKAAGRFRLLTPSDCAESPLRGYIVKGLIAPRDVVLIFGQPGAGKSVVAPHLGYAVALGRSVFGRRVHQTTVLYIASEDPLGMRQRVHALRIEHGDAPAFRLLEQSEGLFDKDGDALAELIRLVGKLGIGLVVVDTLKAAFPALRENESDDMGQVVKAARALAAAGPAVMLTHHVPKGDDSTPRGHGSLLGDVDMAVRLASDGDSGVVRGKLIKNRNGPSGAAFGFTIRAADLGEDDDHDRITAPIAVEVAGDLVKRAGLTPMQETAKRYLADLIVEQGKPVPGVPDGLRGVPESSWRASCESRRLSTAEEFKDRAKGFRRTYKELLQRAIVAARDGNVWLTKPETEVSA